jgi:PPP family 3-phenylpropionic acid transporter
MALSFSVPMRLAAFYFAYFAFAAAMMAYFPLYLAGRGLGAGEIAFVLALPQMTRVFAPAAWGRLADRLGAQRGVVAFSCAVMAACFLLLPAATGTAAIALLIGIMSLLSAGALPLVEAIALASLGGDSGRYGPIRLWGSVGFIVVVLAGGAWLDFGSVETLPAALAAFALISLVAAAGLPSSGVRASPELAESVPDDPAVRSLLAAGFCMAAAHGVLYAFLTLHLQREGYSGTAIGALWALGVLAEIVVFLFLPALFRRYSLALILMFSLACAAVRFLAIAWLAAEPWVLVLAQLLHAATFGAFHAASVAAVQRVFPAAAQGLGQTLFSSVSYGAGGAAGALLAGWAWGLAGPGFAFSLGALAALAGVYFAFRLRRDGL